MVSWRGGPPGARLPSMHHQRGIRSVRCARSCTASSRQHAPAASLWSSPTRGTSQRCRSNDEIAVEQSQHSVPPTECWDYLAERCRGALDRGGVPQRRGRTLVAMRRKSEPSVTFMAGVEMQPACIEITTSGQPSSALRRILRRPAEPHRTVALVAILG